MFPTGSSPTSTVCFTSKDPPTTSSLPIKRPRSPLVVVSDEAVEKLVALNNREQAGYLSHNIQCLPVDISWRRDICRWIYGVVENERCSSVLTWEVAAAAISYFDRYLLATVAQNDGTSSLSEDMVLLVSLASLRIATKLFCGSDKVIGMNFFLFISRGKFTVTEIEQMENEILGKLSWKMHPPTSIDFVFRLLALLPDKNLREEMHRRSMRLLKKDVICDPFFVHIPKSTIALASILNDAEDTTKCTGGSVDISNAFSSLIESAFSLLTPNCLQVQECSYRLREMDLECAASTHMPYRSTHDLVCQGP